MAIRSLQNLVDDPSYKFVNDTANPLKARISKLEELTRRVIQSTNTYGFLNEGTVLSYQGLGFILEQKAARDLRLKVCKVFPYTDDFLRFVESSTAIYQAGTIHSFIIKQNYRQDPYENRNYNHYVPIFLYNHQVFVTDSSGGQSFWRNRLTNVKEKPLSYLYKDLERSLPNWPIHEVTLSRQYDTITCSIFALKDVVAITRNPRLLEQIIFAPDVPHWYKREFTLLPPELMYISQCSNSTNIFLEKLRKDGAPSLVMENFQRKLGKHKHPLDGSQKLANGRAFHFLCKYSCEIMRYLFTQPRNVLMRPYFMPPAPPRIQGPISQNLDLIRNISQWFDEDASARNRMITSGYSGETAQAVSTIDVKTYARILPVIQGFGWPGISLIGQEHQEKFWVLVQHCDKFLWFQKKCLYLLEEAVIRHEAIPGHLALLADRVCVQEHQKQKFGTQIFGGPNNTLVCMAPIEDILQVDTYRQSMHLEQVHFKKGKLVDYVCAVISRFGLHKPLLPPELHFLAKDYLLKRKNAPQQISAEEEISAQNLLGMISLPQELATPNSDI